MHAHTRTQRLVPMDVARKGHRHTRERERERERESNEDGRTQLGLVLRIGFYQTMTRSTKCPVSKPAKIGIGL